MPLLLALLIVVMPTLASAQTPLRVYAAGAVTPTIRELAAAFTRATGTTVDITSDTVGGVQKRVMAGEQADVVVISIAGLEALQKAAVAQTPFTPVGRALLGVAVRPGAPTPDLSTVDTFKASLLNAKSISLVDPAAGGTAGAYMDKLLRTFGIAEQVRGKIVYRNQGALVADAVAAGAAEMGISFTSELTPNPGVRVAGLLPASIQLPTTYAAALVARSTNNDAAQRFIRSLDTPEARAVAAKAGLEAVVAR